VIKDTKIEKLEKSSVKLTVTIEAAATVKGYRELLDKYSKEAVIKGFRKGKVPPSILETKFGDSVKQEAAAHLIDEALKEAFDKVDEKPLGMDYPEIADLPDFEPGKDFTFAITYDIFPEIKLGEYKGLKIQEPQASVKKEDMDAELDKIREQNALVVEKKNKTAAKDDIVTIDYSETAADGSAIPGTERENFTFTVGTGMNYYKIDDEVTGMKVDAEKTFDKTYPADESNKDLAGRTVKLKVKVTAVKEKQIPALDDDLAQDVSDKYKTVEDLKKDIQEGLEKNLKAVIRQKKIDQVLEQVTAATAVEIPKSMIKAELEDDWHQMLHRMGATEEQILPFLNKDGNSKEAIMGQWAPEAERKARIKLVVGKLLETEKMEVTDAEIEEKIVSSAAGYNMSPEDYKKTVGEDKLKQYLKGDMAMEKLFDFLLENAKISKGEKTSYSELVGK
jgi:trigger factor